MQNQLKNNSHLHEKKILIIILQRNAGYFHKIKIVGIKNNNNEPMYIIIGILDTYKKK